MAPQETGEQNGCRFGYGPKCKLYLLCVVGNYSFDLFFFPLAELEIPAADIASCHVATIVIYRRVADV